MKRRIRLAAIDLDGTLFDEHSHISPYNQEIIGKCIAQGVTVVIATGRPYAGLPLEQLNALGVRYAITANGSAVYTLPEGRCIYESSIPHDVLCPLIRKLGGGDSSGYFRRRKSVQSKRLCAAHRPSGDAGIILYSHKDYPHPDRRPRPSD